MIRDNTGRFKQRPHYSPQELDAESETLVTEFLIRRKGAARFPLSTDDLTSLLEKHVEDLDLYSDLRQLGTDVEGVTLFSQHGKPSVRISAALCESKRENRLRTTLSHEFGHVVFHNQLFERSRDAQLFDDAEPSAPMQACREGSILNAGQADWMEWQAGHVSGAILMPATYLRSLIADRFPNYVRGNLGFSPALVESMIEEVKNAFNVSAEAARVRLIRLQVAKDKPSSPTLF
ncbi:MAG: ImmA/IrrE family metallo-endopeptidase [Pseudomonadota bacterium]